jgi:hypothetical protein
VEGELPPPHNLHLIDLQQVPAYHWLLLITDCCMLPSCVCHLRNLVYKIWSGGYGGALQSNTFIFIT